MPVIIRTTAITSKTMIRSKRSSWNCSPPSPMREQTTTTTTNTSLYSPNSPEIGDQFVPNSSRVQNNIHKKTMNISNNNKNSSMNSTKTQTTVFIGQTASTIICPSWSSRRMVLLAILAFFFHFNNRSIHGQVGLPRKRHVCGKSWM